MPRSIFQAAAAETPVGAKEKVKFEDPEVGFVQIALGEEIEIGHIFFVFTAPDAIAFLAGAGLESSAAQVFGLLRTFAELVQTGAEKLLEGYNYRVSATHFFFG